MSKLKLLLVFIFVSLVLVACATSTTLSVTTSSSTSHTQTTSVSTSQSTTTTSQTTTSTTTTTTTQTTITTTTTTTQTPILQVQNGSFETGDLTGWSVVSGDVFETALSSSSSISSLIPYGKAGAYLLAKTEDALTGRLRSSDFDVAGSGYISFRLGGAYNPALTYVSIVDAESDIELARYGNPRFNPSSTISDPGMYRRENLIPYIANLSEHIGKRVYLLLVDESTRNDGYLTFDDLVSYYPTLGHIPDSFGLAVDIKPVFPTLDQIPFELPNGGFQSRTLDGFQVIGEANSFLNSHINAQNKLSNRPNETAVGVLRSGAFKVGGVGLVSFRLGGTLHRDVTYLEVKRVGTNETVLRTYSDRWITAHEENTHLYYVDLSNYMGEAFYIEIVDNSRGDWGLIVVEQIRTFYDTMPKVMDEIAWDIRYVRQQNPTFAVMRSLVDPLIAGIANMTERLTFQKTFYATIDGIQNNKGNFPSVLQFKPNGMTFVITGDIHAMWLRDSSAQVLPYLPFMTVDEDVRLMVKGLLYQQFEQIRRNPYANAFNYDGSVWELKFEIDSLMYPLWLANHYYEITGDFSIFDLFFFQTLEVVLTTLENEQDHSDENYRITIEADRQVGSHTFNPASRLIWSGYRPSDDVTFYKFFIPGNMFAVAVLETLSGHLKELQKVPTLVTRAEALASIVRNAIETYGVYNHPTYGKIYAFEVTGETSDPSSLQGKLLMDAANIPSLLATPWLGYVPEDDPIYQNTRSFILSFDNPYYYEGTYAKGIGDPHDMVGSHHNPHPEVPVPWHMALAMQALTSSNPLEIRQMVDYMVNTTGGTYVMHEAFNANNPADYSRDWFTWPCALFAEVYLYQILQFNIPE